MVYVSLGDFGDTSVLCRMWSGIARPGHNTEVSSQSVTQITQDKKLMKKRKDKGEITLAEVVKNLIKERSKEYKRFLITYYIRTIIIKGYPK